MDRCGDCVNFKINRSRQCVPYNNEASSKDDATGCPEFVHIMHNDTSVDYIAEKQN